VLLRTQATAFLHEREARVVMSTGYDGTLARAVQATAKLQDEIDELWCDSVIANEDTVSDRLVAVSHAIHRVSYLLERGLVIG
jgi:hypothetical protein